MDSAIRTLFASTSPEDRRQCIELLTAYLTTHDDDVEAWFSLACCYDFLGEENSAESCYRACYQCGWTKLPAESQPRFFVGYGSTLRNNLKYEESIQVLREGVTAFSKYPALKIFLAHSLYSHRLDEAALESSLAAHLQTPGADLDGYDRAIQWYNENLKVHPENRRSQTEVRIEDYKIEWPAQFEQIANLLRSLDLPGVMSIDHIGSTSVPGLAAKDRIDVQITIKDLSDELKDRFDEILVAGGFPPSFRREDHKPPGDHNANEHWQKWFVAGAHASLPFHSNIHVRKWGHANRDYALLFRDYLRFDSATAQAYAKTKRELARFHTHDSVAYSEIKDPVCDVIMAGAKRWANPGSP